MRITDDTPAHLKLADRTLWWSGVCLGTAIILLWGAVYDCEPRLLITAGLVLLFALPPLRATDVTFDKLKRICSIRRLDVFRVTRMELAFDDICDARVEFQPMPDDPASPSCRLSLVTKSAVVPLTASFEPNLERFEAMRQTVLDTIFAGRPRPAATDPVRLLVKAGRIIDAVSMLRAREGIDLKSAKARVKELQNAPDP